MNSDNKIISLEEALSFIKSSDHVVTGLGAGEAKLFLENLHTIADRVNNVTITNSLSMLQPKFYEAQYKNSFNIDSMFFSPVTRSSHKNVNVHYVPNHLYLSASDRMKHITPDIFIGSATPPDKHGFMSLSLSNVYETQFIENAKLVILEINENFPRTFGDNEIHIDDVDYLVKADY